MFIRDLITYQATTLKDLEVEFKQSVDAYLQSCTALGKTPDQLFKGTFNVRISPELHRAAAMAADGGSLNSFVADAIQEKLQRIGA